MAPIADFQQKDRARGLATLGSGTMFHPCNNCAPRRPGSLRSCRHTLEPCFVRAAFWSPALNILGERKS